VKKLLLVALTCLSVSLPAIAQDTAAAPAIVATKGKMLVTSNGSRLGPVYHVGSDGSAQVIVDGKMVTIAATTLSITNGQLTTSLTKSEVIAH